MQKTREDLGEVLDGGRYARSEEELFEKAIALLEKCKIESPASGCETSELESVVNGS